MKQYKIKMQGKNLNQLYIRTVHTKSEKEVLARAREKYPFCEVVEVLN